MTNNNELNIPLNESVEVIAPLAKPKVYLYQSKTRSNRINILSNNEVIEIDINDKTSWYSSLSSDEVRDYAKKLQKLLSLNVLKTNEKFNNGILLTEDNITSHNISEDLLAVKYSSINEINTLISNDEDDDDKCIMALNIDRYNKKHIKVEFSERDKDLEKLFINKEISLPVMNVIIAARNVKDKGESLYNYFKIPKPNGKAFREIYEPHNDLKLPLKNLNKVLQAVYNKKFNVNQYAYIKDRNIVSNAEVHKDHKYIIKTDISSFFESTTKDYISKYTKILCKNYDAYDEFMETIINPITNGLYMGNPVSGTLTNLVIHKCIYFLQNIFKKYDISVSIYADDITVSSNSRMKKEFITDIINKVFNFYELNYELKPDKTVSVSNQNRRICGVSINHNNEITIKRKDYYRVRGLLNRLETGQDINIPFTTFKGQLVHYLHVDQTDKFKKLLNKYPTAKNKLKL